MVILKVEVLALSIHQAEDDPSKCDDDLLLPNRDSQVSDENL